MNLSYNWLKEYIDLPEDPKKVALDLTMHTAEVEDVIRLQENLETVVVALVKKTKKHPNADKLLLAIIDDGTQEKQIVCGDMTLKEGQYIAFAPVGTKVKWHGEDNWTVLEEAFGCTGNVS